MLQAALREAGFPTLSILDGGVSGDTTAGGRSRLDWALAERPHGAIVELGGNDGLRGLPPQATAQNLAAIMDRLVERERIPVLLAGMKSPPNLGADYAKDFDQAFAQQAGRAGVIFYPFFLDGVAADPALNQPDGIHPNALGVTEVVRRILEGQAALDAEVERGNPVEAVAAFLPDTEERRRDWKVWFAFWARAAADERLRALHKSYYADVIGRLDATLARRMSPARRAGLADAIVAAVDGISIRAALEPEDWPPERQRRTLALLLTPLFAPGPQKAAPAKTGAKNVKAKRKTR